MSVLVKGMEMPINCDSCRIMVLEDTNCDPELFCGCPLVFKAHPQGEDHRPDYCPLVEIPPHGRLIDADVPISLVDTHGKRVEVTVAHIIENNQGIVDAIIPTKEGET